jgi:Fibrobacter succinogenes major domain (Fib_succ_major)
MSVSPAAMKPALPFCILFLALLTVQLSGCREGGGEATIRIGRQVWMASNLDTGRYRNGDAIREARTVGEWNDAIAKGEGAWCRSGGRHDGERLYNWYAVVDPRGLAPSGWHVPEEREWAELGSVAGGWMRLVPPFPGSRNCLGDFFGQGSMAYFWTSTVSGPFEAWDREASDGKAGMQRVSVSRGLGLSVRCVQGE